MTDFNALIKREIDAAMKKSLSGVKNDALRKAIQDTVTDAVYAKLLKQLNTDVKDIVAETIGELTDDISSKKTARSRAATTRFAANSGSKTSGSKTSPRRVSRPSTSSGSKGRRYGGK